MAAFLRGPNTRKPSFSNTSTMPPTSGSSIPITVRSIAFDLAKSTSLSNSMAPIGTHSAICAIPALPGAQYILSTFGLLAQANAIACSRPPLPTISTFIMNDSFRLNLSVGNHIDSLRQNYPFSLLHYTFLENRGCIAVLNHYRLL